MLGMWIIVSKAKTRGWPALPPHLLPSSLLHSHHPPGFTPRQNLTQASKGTTLMCYRYVLRTRFASAGKSKKVKAANFHHAPHTPSMFNKRRKQKHNASSDESLSFASFLLLYVCERCVYIHADAETDLTDNRLACFGLCLFGRPSPSAHAFSPLSTLFSLLLHFLILSLFLFLFLF